MLTLLLSLTASYYDINQNIEFEDSSTTTLAKQIQYLYQNLPENSDLLLTSIIDPKINESMQDLSEVIAELSGYFIPFEKPSSN